MPKREQVWPGSLLSRLRLGVRRVIRRLAERALGRTYDGASPPPRLVDEVLAFRVLHPDADQGQWEDFALGLAAGAYRDGFAYGVEWRERWQEPVAYDPALLDAEERRRREWTQPVLGDPGDPLAGVPPAHREEVLRELEFAAGYGGFRFVTEDGRRMFPPAFVSGADDDEEEDDDVERGAAGGGGGEERGPG